MHLKKFMLLGLLQWEFKIEMIFCSNLFLQIVYDYQTQHVKKQ